MIDHVEKANEEIEKAKRKALIHILEDINEKIQLGYLYINAPSFSFEQKLLSHIRECLQMMGEKFSIEEIREVYRERSCNVEQPVNIPQGQMSVRSGVRPIGGFTCS